MKTRILALLIGVAIGAYVGGFLSSTTITYFNQSQSLASLMSFQELINESDVSSSSIMVPAVDKDGNGVVTTLRVDIIPGTRKALVDIDRLLFFTDTQNSIRISRSVSENITGKDLSFYDIIYTIEANASIIEGPSAGAAMTVATIAALLDEETDDSVMITGTINFDGTVGQVGEILSKAKAAKDMGASAFLVPPGQSVQTVMDTEEHCETIGLRQVCTTRRIPRKVNVEDETGISVVEIRHIEEALEYFFT